jgi:outer membrane protein OmpA-like peptidoglycan-associated protein
MFAGRIITIFNRTLIRWSWLLLISFCVTDCARKHEEDEEPFALTPDGDTDNSGIGGFDQGLISPPVVSPVYFPPNRVAVDAVYFRDLFLLGRYLARNRLARLEIEGHSDPSGSPRRNMGLGQRRAEEVKKMLVRFGAPVDQIYTVSLGDNCPAIAGRSSLSKRMNRRVEFVLRTGRRNPALPTGNGSDIQSRQSPRTRGVLSRCY